jgi:tRNA uridine 5-carboxymethylaminomethyl modification enzyme
LDGLGLHEVTRSVSGAELLKRPDVAYAALGALGLSDPELGADITEQVETELKYDGYIQKQRAEVERLRRLEDRPLPAGLDYAAVRNLSREGRDKLQRFTPATVGQAARLTGVTPADVAMLLLHIERERSGHREVVATARYEEPQ